MVGRPKDIRASEPITDRGDLERFARKLHLSQVDVWMVRTVPDGYVVYVHEGGEAMYAVRLSEDFKKVGKRHLMTVRDFLFEREKVYP